ncbi:MAG: ABC transporter permease [Chitinispirillia bacterium]|nr:ABC transporter permease [Chitinispirillia bacterium]MCL2269060.1 ABC transporter permease [Chitinispirillia bacterium]
MELFVALRYLRGKRKTIGFVSWITYISAAGVCLGSFVLIVALSIANGFEKEVRDRIIGAHAHAKISRYHTPQINDYEPLRQNILAHPQVVGAAPYITGKGGIEHQNMQEGILINGIDPELEATVTDIHKALVSGEFRLDSLVSNRYRRFPGVIIGKGLSDKMALREGTEVVLYCLPIESDEQELTPKMGRFTVAGVFETGMYEYDLGFVYISIEAAQGMLNMTGVEGIQIRTTDLFKADRIAQDVREFLGGYPFRAVDWQTQNKSLFQWMKLERLIIFIVISLIIVVAAFNIISSLIMMILEKRREIGILMSMGATSKSIMRVFMLNGIVVGFFGSTIGVALGAALGYIQQRWQLIPIPGELYFVNKLPLVVSTFDVIAVYVAANIICWVATIYPAKQAASLLPAESIRYE